MTFYSAMVNAWALAASILDGTFDEDYPIMTDDKNRVTPQESDEYDPPKTKTDSSQDFWIDDGISVPNYEMYDDVKLEKTILIFSFVKTHISEATLIAFFAISSADKSVSIKTFAEARA